MGELVPLEWSHVDWELGLLRLDTSKNGEARVYPFSGRPRLEALLRKQRELTDALEREQGRIIPYVFHRNGGHQGLPRSLGLSVGGARAPRQSPT